MSIFSLVTILTSVFFMSGCNTKNVVVNTVLNVDSSFCGSRTVNLDFPDTLLKSSSSQTIKLEEIILEHCPDILEHKKIQETNSTTYRFKLNFNSLSDYISKIESLTNRPVVVNFFCSDTPLTSGLRCDEDFDSKELFSWFFDKCQKDSILSNLDINLKCAGTKLIANQKEYWTSNKISVSDINFQKVEKISIYTRNNFDGTFNRTIRFLFPKETAYNLDNKLTEYMSSKTYENIGSHGWIYLNGTREYIVSYSKLNLDELSLYTNSIFSMDSQHKIYYQTDINQSNIFKKVDVFQENLDLSSFSSDGKNVNLEYKYETTTQTAKQYINGKLQNVGELINNTFSLNTKTAGLLLYLPNSTDYKVEGIDFKLSYLENNNFEKSIYLKYNKNNKSAISYALWFLNEENILGQEDTTPDKKEYSYKITSSGDSSKISQMGKNIFGETNSFSLSSENYNFNVHNSIKIIDSVRLSKLLVGENENIPITYTINPNNVCIVNSLNYTIGKIKNRVDVKLDSNGNLNAKLPKPDFDLTCSGKTINQTNVILAFSLAFLILLAVICIIIYINHKNSIKATHNNLKRRSTKK